MLSSIPQSSSLLARDLTEHVGMMMMGVSPRFLQKRQMSNEVIHYTLVHTAYPRIYHSPLSKYEGQNDRNNGQFREMIPKCTFFLANFHISSCLIAPGQYEEFEGLVVCLSPSGRVRILWSGNTWQLTHTWSALSREPFHYTKQRTNSHFLHNSTDLRLCMHIVNCQNVSSCTFHPFAAVSFSFVAPWSGTKAAVERITCTDLFKSWEHQCKYKNRAANLALAHNAAFVHSVVQ